MPSRRAGHAFSQVDAQDDPSAWVRVLDRVGQEPFYRAYKQRVAALLQPCQGGRYLEIGGGTGEDARALQASARCTVVMVDASATMVRETRARGLDMAVVGDACALPLASSSLDGCWADRVFQHLSRPESAVAELVRVTRPGGRVVVADPDYDTQVVDVSDQGLARQVLRHRADHQLRNGTVAHRTAGLFVAAGLEGVTTEAATLVTRDHRAVDNVLGLRSWAAAAHAEGRLTAEQADAWPRVFDDAVTSGRFLYALTFFLTIGVKGAGVIPWDCEPPAG